MRRGMTREAPSPLGVMLDELSKAVLEKRSKDALEIAKAAAPYCHPRGGKAAQQRRDSLGELTDEELDELLAAAKEELAPGEDLPAGAAALPPGPAAEE